MLELLTATLFLLVAAGTAWLWTARHRVAHAENCIACRRCPARPPGPMPSPALCGANW